MPHPLFIEEGGIKLCAPGTAPPQTVSECTLQCFYKCFYHGNIVFTLGCLLQTAWNMLRKHFRGESLHKAAFVPAAGESVEQLTEVLTLRPLSTSTWNPATDTAGLRKQSQIKNRAYIRQFNALTKVRVCVCVYSQQNTVYCERWGGLSNVNQISASHANSNSCNVVLSSACIYSVF